MLFKIAFRNIFRNKKRTFLTILVIAIGMMGVLIGISWFNGIENMFMEEGIKATGHIRITHKEYELKRQQMDLSANISDQLLEENGIKFKESDAIIKRIKFGGVVFKDENDERAIGNGIEEKEYKILDFENYIYEGRFLNFKSKNEIIIGEKIREKLNLKLNEKVTILTNTQYGSIYARSFKIVGFYKMDNSRLNRSFYIKLSDAKSMLDMPFSVMEYNIFLENINDTKPAKDRISEKLQKYSVDSWNEIGMNKYMSQILPVIKVIFMAVFGILAGVVIANTMMMVVFERKKEIGILKSMGMINIKVVIVLCIEGVIIGIIGSLIGTAIGGLISWYFSVHGIVLGQVLETVTNEMNIQTIIYMQISKKMVLGVFVYGIFASFFFTLFPGIPELRKNAIDDLYE